jgi:histidinol phosphatase-like enzyme
LGISLSFPARFCFGLDGTLVTPPPTPDAYEDAQPIEKTVAIARELHAAGHTVVVGAGQESDMPNFKGS